MRSLLGTAAVIALLASPALAGSLGGALGNATSGVGGAVGRTTSRSAGRSGVPHRALVAPWAVRRALSAGRSGVPHRALVEPWAVRRALSAGRSGVPYRALVGPWAVRRALSAGRSGVPYRALVGLWVAQRALEHKPHRGSAEHSGAGRPLGAQTPRPLEAHSAERRRQDRWERVLVRVGGMVKQVSRAISRITLTIGSG